VIEHQRALRDGRYLDDVAWLLVATPTLVDPSRAPRGRHTVKLLSAQPWLEGDRWQELKERQAHRQLERVRRFCPDFAEGAILAMLVKSPVDIEAQNRHMIRGTFHGGDRTVAQSGPLRPAPGWGQYRMPIPGLYQTGGTTHPGGSITGAPGRNAATVLLQDLGLDLEEVVSGARRPRAGSHR
jgi:phytoene dehydrogenase-like protein